MVHLDRFQCVVPCIGLLRRSGGLRGGGQCLHHLFHLHESRSLHQHAAHLGQRLPHRCQQRCHVVKMRGRAKGLRGVPRQRAQRVQPLDAACTRMGPGLGVELRPLVAHLAHIAQHQQARRGQFGQHLDGGVHGVRVGVVAVVHHGDGALAATHTQRTRTALDRRERAQAARDGVQWHARRQCTGCGGLGVGHVVAARNVQRTVQRPLRRGQDDLPGAALPLGLCAAHIGLRTTKGDAAPPRRQVLPQRGVGIARRKHGHAVFGQRGQHRAVFFGHGLHGVHEFQVLALRVVHQGHGGLGNACQQGDLAGVVHAQLDHAHAVRGVQAQQGLRYADGVVEVAARGKRGILRVRLQDGGNHLCDRGLAIAAGDRDQGQVELRTPRSSQVAQGLQAVGHFDARQPGGLQAALGQGGHSAAGAGLGQKVVGVKALTAQGHEQIARLQGARVRVHARQGRGAIAHQACARLA
jgi:hypothetical protein